VDDGHLLVMKPWKRKPDPHWYCGTCGVELEIVVKDNKISLDNDLAPLVRGVRCCMRCSNKDQDADDEARWRESGKAGETARDKCFRECKTWREEREEWVKTWKEWKERRKVRM